MISSTQITNEINKKHDPQLAEFQLWKKTRYLVAQQPASPDYRKTKLGYYEGRVVIPGPKCNTKVSDKLTFDGSLNINDFQIMKNRFYIRFVDNRTTTDADESIGKALYTIMSKSDADRYEEELFKQQKEQRNDNQHNRVSSATT